MKTTVVAPAFVAFVLIFNTSLNAQENQSNTNRTTDASPSVNPFLLLSNALSGKPAELERLIKEKKLKEADSYLGSEQKFFTENRQSQIEIINKLANELNLTYQPMALELDEAWRQTVAPYPVNDWKKINAIVLNTETLLEEHGKLNAFKMGGKKSEKISSLEFLYRSKQNELKAHSVNAFLEFDHFSENSFFSLYPIKLNEIEFFVINSEALKNSISKYSAEQVSKFSKTYGAYIDKNSALQEIISSQFVQSSIDGNQKGSSIEKILTTVKKAKEQGIPLKNIPGARMAFVEVTSKSLLIEGQIEFPMQIEMDLPLDPIKTDLDVLAEKVETISADYVVIVDVAVSKVNRRILVKEDHESRFITGTRSSPNPDYDIARGKLFEAQAGLSNAQNTYAYGIAGAVLKIAAIALWQGNVTNAERLLSNTPSLVSSNLFDSYKYSSSDVKVTRSLTANYYVIDRSSKQYYKGLFDIEESKPFKISYNIHDKDPERGTILSRFAKEDDIVSYEKTPISIKASMLVEDYIKNKGQLRSLNSMVALRQEMLRDKNVALTAYKEKQFDAKPLNDSRFDSVVVILSSKGSLGAGFYVAPDLVLTNYHVVQGTQFAEMKLYNGMETFGKVVKSDVRLDLALIKVQNRGVPVNLFEGTSLDLGSTVEAIGHPKGLNFSITRGVISAVRKRTSPFAVGGKDVLFVQTDTAINPGNSGGPLFLGSRVVGVNNNKMVAGSEGLGFAIHYSEVKDFLKESF